MADKLQLIQEAYRRGILPEKLKPVYEEAARRGLIGGAKPETGKQYENASTEAPEAVFRGRNEEPPKYQPGRFYGAEKKKAAEFANYQASPLDAPFGSYRGEEAGSGEATRSNLRDASWYRDPQNQIKSLSASMGIPAEQFEVTPEGIAYTEPNGKKYLVDTGMKANTFIADQTGGSLPANIGATVGGMVGGVEGAALGMGAGEAYRQRVANRDMGEDYSPKAVLDTIVTAEMVGKPLSMIGQMKGNPDRMPGYSGKDANRLSPESITPEYETRRAFQESQGITPTVDTLTDNPTIRNFGDAVPSSIRESNQSALESGAAQLQKTFDTGLTDKAKAMQKGAQEFVSKAQKESSKRYTPVHNELDRMGRIAPSDVVYAFNRDISGLSGEAGKRVKALVEDGMTPVQSVSGASSRKGWLFSELQSLKSDLGDLAYKAKLGQEGLTSKDARAIKNVAKIVKSEMAKIVDNQPDKKLADAWKAAEDYHQNVYVPAKNSKVMNNIRAMETPDQALSTLMPASKSPSVHRAQIVYKNMTPEGQKNMASMMVDNLFESARNSRGELDPKALADNALQWKSSLDIFLGDNKAMHNFVKLARQMEAQSRYLARKGEGMNPDLHATSTRNALLYHAGSSATGATIGAGAGGALGGALGGGVGAAAGALAGGGIGWLANRQILRYLFLNKRGQNWLLRMTNSSMNERQAMMPIIEREAQKFYPDPYEAEKRTNPTNMNPGGGAFQNGIPEPVGRNQYEHFPKLVNEPDMNAVKAAFNRGKLNAPEKPAPESDIVDSTFTEVQPKRLSGPKEALPKPGAETGAKDWDINGKRVQGQATADYEWMRRNKTVKNWPPKDEPRPKSATQHPGAEDFENTQPVEIRLNDKGNMTLISPIPDRPGKWKVDVVDDASKTNYGRMKKDGTLGEPGDEATVYHSRGEAIRAAHLTGYKQKFDDFKKANKAQEVLSRRANATQKPVKQVAKSASWIIRNKSTGEVIMETFDPKKVKALNTDKYEAVPIKEYLSSLSEKSSRSNTKLPSSTSKLAEIAKLSTAKVSKNTPVKIVETDATKPLPGEHKPTKLDVAESIKTSAAKLQIDLRKAKAKLLTAIDDAIKNAYPREKLSNPPVLMYPRDATKAQMAEAAAKHKKEVAKWEQDESSTFVVFDVPGDGKFRVRNAIENLTEFKKKVAASKGFSDRYSTPTPATDKGKGFSATVNYLIESGDIDNAVNLMESRGDTSPVFFGAGHGNHATLYTKVSPIKIDGENFIVGFNPLDKHKPWRVIEPKSAFGIGVQEKTKELAIKEAERVMKTMRNKYDDAMSTAEKIDQLDLLKRYVENNKK